MKITWSDKVTEKESIVIIARKNSSFDPYLKTTQDKDYLAFNLKNKKSQFILNHFPRWIFISLIDEEKEYHASLEESRKAAKTVAEQIASNKMIKPETETICSSK